MKELSAWFRECNLVNLITARALKKSQKYYEMKDKSDVDLQYSARYREVATMVLLSSHESIVWREFQLSQNTSSIAEEHKVEAWSPAYVSRVLNRAREKKLELWGRYRECNSHVQLIFPIHIVTFGFTENFVAIAELSSFTFPAVLN